MQKIYQMLTIVTEYSHVISRLPGKFANKKTKLDSYEKIHTFESPVVPAEHRITASASRASPRSTTLKYNLCKLTQFELPNYGKLSLTQKDLRLLLLITIRQCM